MSLKKRFLNNMEKIVFLTTGVVNEGQFLSISYTSNNSLNGLDMTV